LSPRGTAEEPHSEVEYRPLDIDAIAIRKGQIIRSLLNGKPVEAAELLRRLPRGWRICTCCVADVL
jgi:hypothetical protein